MAKCSRPGFGGLGLTQAYGERYITIWLAVGPEQYSLTQYNMYCNTPTHNSIHNTIHDQSVKHPLKRTNADSLKAIHDLYSCCIIICFNKTQCKSPIQNITELKGYCQHLPLNSVIYSVKLHVQ